MSSVLVDRTAVVGIGATEFSKNSGRSELRLAVEAITAALDDAGLRPADVDGLVTYTMDTNPEIEVARNLGIDEVKFVARSNYGGGGTGTTFQLACMAVATGIANVVVVYRAFNERSGRRFGSGVPASVNNFVTSQDVSASWNRSFGITTPAGSMAMIAQRYMHESGATTEDFGRIAVVDRHYAATNPAARFYQAPITLEEHQASRWIVEPLRLLDCCQETDGGIAFVVTSLERARDLKSSPVVIRSAAQGIAADQELGTSYYRPELGLQETEVAARQLWEMSGLTQADIGAAILYDHFSPFVLMQLEALGFCDKGEARHFVADGHLELGGRLPVNTHGGQLGEAYMHGFNGVSEAVVAGVENVLVTGGPAVPTSGMILGVDR